MSQTQSLELRTNRLIEHHERLAPAPRIPALRQVQLTGPGCMGNFWKRKDILEFAQKAALKLGHKQLVSFH